MCAIGETFDQPSNFPQPGGPDAVGICSRRRKAPDQVRNRTCDNVGFFAIAFIILVLEAELRERYAPTWTLDHQHCSVCEYQGKVPFHP